MLADLLQLADDGGSIVVGSVTDAGRPLAARCWSIVAEEPDRLLLAVQDEAALRGELPTGASLSVTAASVLTYRAVQCRGEVLELVQLDAALLEDARRRSQGFVQQVAHAHQERPERVATMVPSRLLGVRIRPLEYFDQTPRSRAPASPAR